MIYHKFYSSKLLFGASFLLLFLLGQRSVAQEFISGKYDSEREIFVPASKSFQVKSFREGLAPYRHSGDYGLIDTTGQIICKPQYEEIEGFSGGVSLVTKFDGSYRTYGFINKEGREVVPASYDYGDRLFERSTRIPGVLLVRKKNLYTAYNYQGEILLPERYTMVSSFRDGRSLVFRDGHYGFINKSWEEIIPAEYEEAKEFQRGRALVKKAGLWGMIDLEGQSLLDFQYESIANLSGLNRLLVKSNGLYGHVSVEGEILIPAIYGSLGRLKEGRMKMILGDLHGYINSEGQVIIEPEYEWAGDFSQGRAIAKKDGKWGHIDTLNQVITPFKYDKTAPFGNGYGGIQMGALYGKVNLKGKIIIPCAYHGIGHFKAGVAPVLKREDGKKLRGLIDTNGRIVLPCQYEEFRDANADGIRPVRKGGLWGFAGADGELLIACQYAAVESFQDAKAWVFADGERFQIDLKGKRLN